MKSLRTLHDEAMAFVYRFLYDQKAGMGVKSIILSAVGFLLVAILTPIGMDEIVGANTTGWETSVKTIFTILLPILYVIGVAIAFIHSK